jgi:purine-binding chemotaxis protein CheW
VDSIAAGPTPADAPASGPAVQFITCRLGPAEYGVDIMAVREIKGWTETTAIPHAPPWIRGVINLRGVIVPILDLRVRFGMSPTEPTPTHVVVIVQSGERTAGVLVDAVSDIITIGAGDIRPVPEIGTGSVPVRLLTGLVPREQDMVSIMSLETLLDFQSASLAVPAEAVDAHPIAA